MSVASLIRELHLHIIQIGNEGANVEVEILAKRTGANISFLECANHSQAQGKPQCISTFRVHFFYQKYKWSHVMCIRC
jgi:hypothetical protein